jgi:hypothetical protein
VKTRRPQFGNVFAAFAVAPLGGALLVGVIGILLGLVTDWGSMTGRVVGMAFIVTAGAGYAAAFVLGIPGFLLFRHLRWIRGAHWVLLCASIGAVTGSTGLVTATVMLGGEKDIWAALGGVAVAGGLIGAVSGLVFARTIDVIPPGADEIAATFD